jgi:hypothetical protein
MPRFKVLSLVVSYPKGTRPNAEVPYLQPCGTVNEDRSLTLAHPSFCWESRHLSLPEDGCCGRRDLLFPTERGLSVCHEYFTVAFHCSFQAFCHHHTAERFWTSALMMETVGSSETWVIIYFILEHSVA